MQQQIDKRSLIAVRDYDPKTDESFVYSTWLKGLYYGNPFYSFIDSEVYFSKYRVVIENLLKRSTIKIACLKDDPEVILAYCVHEGRTLHWAHSKQAWRGIGLFRDLVPKDTDTVSHLTTVGQAILRKHVERVKFNPFLF